MYDLGHFVYWLKFLQAICLILFYAYQPSANKGATMAAAWAILVGHLSYLSISIFVSG
jgi:hypothetical protein